MSAEKVFVDSNVFLYLLSEDLRKCRVAAQLLSLSPFISPQVLFENINVAVKKFGFSKKDALAHANKLLEYCTLTHDSDVTLQRAFSIFENDSIQLYDCRIIASALDAGCDILYSEDLQHLRVFESQMVIINPFKL